MESKEKIKEQIKEETMMQKNKIPTPVAIVFGLLFVNVLVAWARVEYHSMVGWIWAFIASLFFYKIYSERM